MRMSACIPALCCTDLNRRPIWYSVALKAPKGDMAYVYWPESINMHKPKEQMFDTWLADAFGHTNQIWTGHLYYNDQLPEGYKELPFLNGIVNDGHCKGVVLWNADRVGWLIHSVPQFPVMSSLQIPHLMKIPESGKVYGQSAIYLEMPRTRDTLDDVFIQICTMQAQIYSMSADVTEEMIDSMRRIYRSAGRETAVTNPLPILDKRRHRITHLAKPGPMNYDFYMVNVTHGSPAPIVCETWQNGSGGKSPNIARVTNLRAVGAKWDSIEDHSKWAISMPYVHRGWFRTQLKNRWRVCVGDLNRMDSQKRRGGGGIIIDGNQALWEWFYSLAFCT